MSKKLSIAFGLLLIASMALAACQPVVQTVQVEVTSEPEVITETQIIESTQIVEVEKGAFTTPNPILSDVRVRQAMAYCTNRLEMIQAVYPLLPEEEQGKLVMNTFIPPTHWAYAGDENVTVYPFDPEKGKALLDEAGWIFNEDEGYRYNDAGDELALKLTTTDRASRQTWAAVWEAQMANCGIRVLRQHVPATWFFGASTGLNRRDYELGAFAWVGQPDPSGQTLYACDQIPLPENGWEGQNGMGWCNEAASKNIKLANNTIIQDERIEYYKIVQQEFTKDMVSLPLFLAPDTYAIVPDLANFDPRAPEEYYTYNIEQWELPGRDTVVIGTTQEPDSLFDVITSQWTARVAYWLITGRPYTGLDYTFQPVLLKDLPTVENGGALNNDVEVSAGTMVIDANGDLVELANGVKVRDASGAEVEFTGDPVKMKQLVVTYTYLEGMKFSDGTPVTKADFELGYKAFCDPESGNVSYINCEKTQSIDYIADNAYTITYVPGAQDPTYSLPYFNPVAAHVVVAEGDYAGKTLAEVPIKDWRSLPEISEMPIGAGPYMLKEWVKGEKLVFEANPYYVLGEPKIKNVVISVITPENAEAQLISGAVDVLGSETLTGITETLQKAADEGKIKLVVVPGGTWEHIDMNLFLR